MKHVVWLFLLLACDQQKLPRLGEDTRGYPGLPGTGGTSSSSSSSSSSSGGTSFGSSGAPDPFVTEPVNRPLETVPLTECVVEGQPRKRAAADFIFMVDNSASMLEEQTNLALSSSSLCRTDAPCSNPCGTQENLDVLKAFAWGQGCGKPPRDWPVAGNDGDAALAILRDCSFLERLYVQDVDWQVGVVTTEMRDGEGIGPSHVCTVGAYPQGRLPRPQRGCLQPELETGQRIITSKIGTHAEHVQWFRSMVLGVGLCGSGLERGLSAVEQFVSRTVEPASPECAADPDVLLRASACTSVNPDGSCARMEEPALVALFLTDEEDCSYSAVVDGGPNGENPTTGRLCYTRPDTLRPTQDFVDSLKMARANPDNVRLAGIVGGSFVGSDFVPQGCRCNNNHSGAEAITNCTPTHGNSLLATLCGAQVPDPYCMTASDPRQAPPGSTPADPPCCSADVGQRYATVVQGVHKHALESICAQKFHAIMARVADLAR